MRREETPCALLVVVVPQRQILGMTGMVLVAVPMPMNQQFPNSLRQMGLDDLLAGNEYCMKTLPGKEAHSMVSPFKSCEKWIIYSFTLVTFYKNLEHFRFNIYGGVNTSPRNITRRWWPRILVRERRPLMCEDISHFHPSVIICLGLSISHYSNQHILL